MKRKHGDMRLRYPRRWQAAWALAIVIALAFVAVAVLLLAIGLDFLGYILTFTVPGIVAGAGYVLLFLAGGVYSLALAKALYWRWSKGKPFVLPDEGE